MTATHRYNSTLFFSCPKMIRNFNQLEMRGGGDGTSVLLACELGCHGWSGMGLKELLILPSGFSKSMKHTLAGAVLTQCLEHPFPPVFL